jgi:hypothetical protein
MTTRLPQLLGKISFALAVLLILPGLISGIGVFAALINLMFAGTLALTGRLLWPLLTAVATAVNVFAFSAFTLAADRGVGAWASVVVPFVLVACCLIVGRLRAGRS